ncbi:MAG TPA: hypothetical protein VFL90_05605 [Methylomirabilota bacterium]|nr:hypothetical protein [Methylomirabilota bacterium]
MRAGRRLLPLLLALALGGAGGTSTLFDYVTFDGIDYIRWSQEAGRALVAADLGPEFATVECSFGEDLRGCPYGLDASAAFLPAGTRMYEVRGHATGFRLAAVWRERIFLYQAWRNPKARRGGDLYALAGKVREIQVQRGEPEPGTARAASAITAPADVQALVEMIVRAPMRRPRPHAVGEGRYWLTFWLTDGTTLERPYFVEGGELMGGVAVPEDFRRLLERALRE